MFFANNNPQLENTLATTDFSQFGKEGIPLEYSRTEFLSDLCKTLEGLPETEQADILKRLEITPVESGLADGYDGIINVNTENLELDLTNPVEAKVYELANKFIRENSVHTGDEAHNESNLYNPKINAVVAKYNSLEKLAAEYPDILEFAQEHNLPIYLLG